jgi:putative zinc finger/helix-turn-helix YgiT family protein
MEPMVTKPYPWMCPNCREKTVAPALSDYALTAMHDGLEYEVCLRNVLVPRCERCGDAIITSGLSQQITAELRRMIGLLPGDAIRANRERLGLTRAQLAATLRVGEETLARWETGGQLQPRAVDLLMRLYFDSAEVRKACVA